MWLCSRRSALTTCKTSNIPIHSSRAPRAQQGAGCPRTQRSRPPTPAAAAPLSVLARSPGGELKGVRRRWGGGLFWRLSSRRSTHAVRPARPGIRSTQSPRPPVNPPPPSAWRVCARRCAELCRPSSDDHEHDEEDELAHAAAQVVRGEERLEEAACRAERGGAGWPGQEGQEGRARAGARAERRARRKAAACSTPTTQPDPRRAGRRLSLGLPWGCGRGRGWGWS